MRKETLITLSRRTGFSVSTVSRVLNGKANKYRISEKTVKLITEEANSRNYKPSLLAKGLRTQKTNTIGLLVPGIDNPYFANIASTVISETSRLGYTTVLVDTMGAPTSNGPVSNRSYRAWSTASSSCRAGRNPTRWNRSTATARRWCSSTAISNRRRSPTTNNYEGGLNATKYLIGFGHRDILCIRGVPHSMPARERERGYLDALREAGLEDRARIAGNDFSIQNGYLETKFALSGSARPTAIFAMSNTILLGTIKAIKESGLRIPDDISVVSFDNYTYLDYLDPAITRVSQRISEMGALAVKILLQRIEGTGNDDAKIQLSPQLIVCNSVAHAHGEK